MAKRKKTPRARRVDLNAGAVIRVKDVNHQCRILNIASSGVLVSAPKLIAPKTRLQIALNLPEVRDPLVTRGVVVRTGARLGKAILGIQFFQPDEEFKAAFKKFLEWYEPKAANKRGQPQTKTAATSPKERRKDPTRAGGPLTWRKEGQSRTGTGPGERKKMSLDDLNALVGVQDPLNDLDRRRKR